MNNIACSICLESFTRNCDISAIPCGHVFHYNCIFKWIGNGNKHCCSQCRKTCTIEKTIKLFFSENNESAHNVRQELENENLKLKKALQIVNKKCLDVQEEKANLLIKMNQKCLDIQEEKLKLSTKLDLGRSNQSTLEINLKVQREDLAFKDQKIKNLNEKIEELQKELENEGSPYQSIQNSPLTPKNPQVWFTLSNHKNDEELCLTWLKTNYEATANFSIHLEHKSMYQKYLESMHKLGKKIVISKSTFEACVR